ncbi:MAG: dTDP-4-dehydrorhamnose reductase [SAR324 cluster bacterium]|nr:dTDP-4-dehydrorhamnose reductase [SAR324 cluster bacterium]
MKLLIAGANGMFAHDLIQLLQQTGDVSQEWDCHAPSETEFNITELESIEQTVYAVNPHILINCAAYTQVDQAETDIVRAKLINEEGVQNLAHICAKNHVKLIHLSTDFVFDGNQSEPYLESDEPNPQGVYAQTKLAGEQAIQNSDVDHLIVRTSWLYGAAGHNFVKTMLHLAQEHPELKVVCDQIGSPTWTVDLAKAMLFLLKADAAGIVHFSNQGQCSWHEFAKETIQIAHELDYLPQLTPVLKVSTTEYPLPAKRPAFSVLNCDKYTTLTKQVPPPWKSSLKQMLTKQLQTD